MSAASIGPVKAMILTLEADRLAAFLNEELASSGSSESLRPALSHFAERHGIAA
jgi:phosphotransferase system, enzyme I, PtsP